MQNPDPTRHRLFLDPSGQDSVWARRFVLKQVINEGHDDPVLYNPTRSPTKSAKWLANFNPRSPTVGSWPHEHRKPAADPRFTGSRTQLNINGRPAGMAGFGLGTPGNYLSGMLPELVSRDALFLNTAIGFRFFFSARRSDGGGASYNSRLSPIGPLVTTTGEAGFHENAARLLLDGAFNVNSTDPEAWAALLASMCDVEIGGTFTPNAAFPRVANTPGGEVTGDTAVDDANQYIGFRALDPDEVRELADRIVEEIRGRGPATSLADFVNRSAAPGAPEAHRLKGALQAAIDATGINASLADGGRHVITPDQVGRIYDTEAFAGDIAAAVPGYLTQGDLLERLGHVMTARSDTFVIRTRGESLDAQGRVMATAICEATVQRIPDYTDPAVPATMAAEELDADSITARFGRAFRIVSFRWLSSAESAES